MSLEGGREGRGWEGGREEGGREEGGEGGREEGGEGGREGMTYTYYSDGPQYLYNNDVTYYVIM